MSLDPRLPVRRARKRVARALDPETRREGGATTNPLEEFFRSHDGRLLHKWTHYFEIYHRHLERFRDRPVVVVEFGVSHGGSLQMWRRYFGEQARIYGVDINPDCRKLEEPGTRIFIGDQSDRSFLREIADEIGPMHVLIEDGGHEMDQQIATFEVMYPRLKPRGVFLIEDLHTSYWPDFGGGYHNPATFIEYAKQRIDQLNAWHSQDPRLVVDDFTRTTHSIHFYDSVAVFERRPISRPEHRMAGRPSL